MSETYDNHTPNSNPNSHLDLRDLPLWADDALDAGDTSEEEAYALLASGERAEPMYPAEDTHLEAAYEARTELSYDGFDGCWPGDGSGMDDLADFNAMEGCDM